MKKDTIYIDIDDEITSITDKVQNSSANIIALVLPKRCTVLQSSVNMKILKKTSDEAGKNLVLITSESAILPLAGAAGMFVAKTLQSKPVVPSSPESEEPVNTINEDGTSDKIDTNKSIGELAGAAAVSAVVDEDTPIEIGDEPAETDKPKVSKKSDKAKKDKKLKVPNFDKFRTRLFLIIGGVALFIIFMVFAIFVWPKATVAITTENKSVPIDLTISANPSASAVDMENKIVPATTKTQDKTETKKFTATGEKNAGTKASGTVSIYNCSAEDRFNGTVRTVPAGTGISSGGMTFITQKEVSVSPSKINFNGSNCQKDEPAAVDVVAQNPGDSYNLGPRTYAVAGFGTMSANDTKGMSGGSNKMVKVVSESDCDTAKNELLNAKTEDYKNQMAGQLVGLGLTPIRDTFTASPGAVSCSPGVNQEATEATANVTFKLSMIGVNTSGLEEIIKAEVQKDVDATQEILDPGLKTANLTVVSNEQGNVVFRLTGDVQVGAKQDSNAIAKSIAGKKKGDSISIIKAEPGVIDVKISYSPFWVYKTPSNVKHISVKYVNNVSN